MPVRRSSHRVAVDRSSARKVHNKAARLIGRDRGVDFERSSSTFGSGESAPPHGALLESSAVANATR
eukprot:4862705-Prymnesium_polylepis.1